MESDKLNLRDVLTVSEVAEYLGLHPKTVCAYIAEGRMRAIRCGRAYRIRREWVLEYIQDAMVKE